MTVTYRAESWTENPPGTPTSEPVEVWKGKTAEYEGWTVFPAEHRARPESGTAVALLVNGEVIAVQRSEDDDIAIKAATAAEQDG